MSQESYYIQTGTGAQKVGIIVEEVHGHDRLEKESTRYEYHYSKPKVFSKSHQIQRTILPSQKSQILSTQRVIHPTNVERKQLIQPLNLRPRVHSRSEVKSRDMARQDKHYSPQ